MISGGHGLYLANDTSAEDDIIGRHPFGHHEVYHGGDSFRRGTESNRQAQGSLGISSLAVEPAEGVRTGRSFDGFSPIFKKHSYARTSGALPLSNKILSML